MVGRLVLLNGGPAVIADGPVDRRDGHDLPHEAHVLGAGEPQLQFIQLGFFGGDLWAGNHCWVTKCLAAGPLQGKNPGEGTGQRISTSTCWACAIETAACCAASTATCCARAACARNNIRSISVIGSTLSPRLPD